MERRTDIEVARKYFGENFVGAEELFRIRDVFPLLIPEDIPGIPYSREELEWKADDYLLVLCLPSFNDGRPVNILTIRDMLGVNPDDREPCFYNQDWYLNEEFVRKELDFRWILVRKKVFEDTRSVAPEMILKRQILPTAILSCYTFFIAWMALNVTLWKNDFIWCSDTDHNGDRIYVGKYADIDGINKNGFSIHRHLALRNCYASIDAY